jgi:replicative DNA helicase
MVVDIKNVEPNQAEDIYIKNFEFVNFRKGSLNFVCARVGNCKTQTLLNMFLQLSMVTEKDYNAVFFSLEMLKEDLKARLISMDKD